MENELALHIIFLLQGQCHEQIFSALIQETMLFLIGSDFMTGYVNHRKFGFMITITHCALSVKYILVKLQTLLGST